MLVFLHGFLGSKADWEPLFEHLPANIERVAIDHNGTIESVKKELDRLGATEIIGYSAGGRLALHLKDLYPDSFTRIAVLSGHPRPTKADPIWLERLRSLPLPEFLDLWYEQPLFDSLKKKPALLKQIKESRMRGDREKFAAFYEALTPGLIPAPKLYPETLFMYGEEDLKYRALYHTLPPFITVAGVANSGHILPLENPEGCVDAIVRFFQN